MNKAKTAGTANSGQYKKAKTWSLLLFAMFLIIATILVIIYFPEIKKELALLKKVKPFWLFTALLGQLLTYVFTAIVYLALLKVYKLPQLPHITALFKAAIISLFFNQTLPSAGISGNTYFFQFLARYRISKNKIISLILGELLIFYAAMETIIVTLLIICLFTYRVQHAFTSTLTAGMIVYLVFACMVVLAGKNNMLHRLYAKAMKLRLIRKISNCLAGKMPVELLPAKEIQLREIVKHHKPDLAKAFFFQFLVVAADGFTLYVIFLGLGLQVSPFIILIAFICTKIISILPFLPGALVLYESSLSFFLSSTGIPVGAAIIATLVYRLLSFWLPMPVGAFLYRKWIISHPPADHDYTGY
ncbi:hypothetical protein A4D02_27490 [Niastella koreensis]|uniref:Lysylphosphatidylglycerol synthetase/UPF0104 n=2 Tax=Niastella koreensis TaxID=354356 RepID=G8TGY5_NIAKG|nr:lysylphosphatidylglycerol synthase transmembrane domain-containing protein [Niastella koreensis]AEV99587.1 hypothetical protein Niako_3261 [Niastella koreensis GR20-10]OQP50177.1 hypothetical protein A4D02_27490 [Niastella koreensis]